MAKRKRVIKRPMEERFLDEISVKSRLKVETVRDLLESGYSFNETLNSPSQWTDDIYNRLKARPYVEGVFHPVTEP